MKSSNNFIPIISFPRSGNTWLRFILANLFKADHIHEVDYSNLNIIMPTERAQLRNFDYSLLSKNAPITLKEHYNYYNLNLDFDKSIYLKRNFSDTIQSYWFFSINKEPLLFNNFKEFIRTYWRYCGTYTEHIKSLKSIQKSDKKIFVINYEDLYSDTFSTISSCLKYLEIDYSDRKINQAIEASNYSRLKKLKQNIFDKKDIKNFEKIVSIHDDENVDKNIYNRILNYYIGLRFQKRRIQKYI